MSSDVERMRAAAGAARASEHHFPADCLMEAALTIETLRAEPTWTEQEIREAYDHGSTAGVCEDVDDIISALHYRFHGWSEPCCSSADDGTTP